MKTSPELLTDILGVLGAINLKLDTLAGSDPTGQRKSESKESRRFKSAMGDFNIKDFAQDSKTNENIRDTADAMKVLSTSLTPLAKGLKTFASIPKFARRSIIDFMKEMLDLGNVVSVENVKKLTTSMAIISDALPNLAKGVVRFGIVSKLGFVGATMFGIRVLFLGLATLAPTIPVVAPAAAALAAIGVALNGIANVLGSIAKLVLAFAGAIVIMVGAIFLASVLFKVGPLAAMGIIVGSIAILAGGFALIGVLSPLIASAGTAIKQMGVGMGILGLGLLALVGSLALINVITGGQSQTDAAIYTALKTTAIMSLIFAGLGLIGGLIRRGGIAVQEMAKGILYMAGGLLAMGGALALLNLMHVDLGVMIPGVAKSIALLGLVFAGLGILSPLIMLGLIPFIGIALTLGLFALISLGIGATIKKLGGKEGLTVMSDNIGLLVGGVLKGVISGVSSALLGDASGKGFFGKLVTVGKNVSVLIGSIFLLIGVSWALIMFATSLRAFQRAGYIKDKDGRDINVVLTAENIAKSIGQFFTTLTTTFKNPKILPDKKTIEDMVDILMGNKGFRILGIRIMGKKRPGLIDALSKFGDLISIFAKHDQIPIYDINDRGEVKQTSFTKPKDVAKNIVDAISAFFTEFSNKKDTLSAISTATSQTFAEVLLGQDAFRLLGFRIGKDKHGLLEPILKFSEVLTSYSKISEKGFPTAFDDKGNATHWAKPAEIASDMVKGISDFMTAFSTAFNPTAGSLSAQSTKILDNMGEFGKVIKKLGDFGSDLTNIDKLALSIGSLASNIGLLVANMGELNTTNLEKLTKVTADYAKKTQGMSPVPYMPPGSGGGAGGGAGLSKKDLESLTDAFAQKVGQIMANSKFGSYDFTFWNGATGGKLELKPQ